MYYPIIYVRGYAASTTEQNETTADPFCGFNLGSTVYRATPDRKAPPRKFIFESPVIRLASEHGYKDVYENGFDIVDPEWPDPDNQDPAKACLAKKSVIIYRYYDEASSLLGLGKTPSIEHFAQGLGDLILKVRDLVCKEPANGINANTFKCYLVAHSMGGLIVRAFLQNSKLRPKIDNADVKNIVDKVFTYATPHNGIEMAGMNVPEFLKWMDMDNFNRNRMAGYLNLEKFYNSTGSVDWLPEDIFPSNRFFCMIGTNRSDYEVAMGTSRTFAGHGSDGLVRIENASVCGIDRHGKATKQPAARAYCYRSHSGFFGIVNSEEAYQNLARFLFGTNRADVWLQVDSVQLPANPNLQASANKVDAAYQFEIMASPKGKPWHLTRRVAEEDSVAVRSHKELSSADPEKRRIYLSTIFLDKKARVNPKVPKLTFKVTIGVRVPDYVLDNKFWFNEHFEGAYLCNDTFIIEISPPDLSKKQSWDIRCRRLQDHEGMDTVKKNISQQDGQIMIEIPIGDAAKQPGISGKLQIIASAWNR